MRTFNVRHRSDQAPIVGPSQGGTISSRRARSPTPIRPGVNWKPDRQRLYRFTRSSITVIQPWPSALCWEKLTSWRGAHTKVRLDFLDLGTSAPYPYRFEVDAWSTVPPAVRQRVLRASLVGLQWNSLRLLARCPVAAQLVDEIPLLAAAAANLRILRRCQEMTAPKKPWRDLRRALGVPRSRQRWRRVARLLGWPQERSFFRVLRAAGTLEPEVWPLMDVARLGPVWRVPWLRKVLQHGPPLTAGRLAAVVAALELVALGRRLPARVFLDLADDHAAENLAGAIQSLAHAALRHAPSQHPCFEQLDSLDAIEHATAQLIELVPMNRPFPPPPLQAVPGIRPLDSAAKLVDEGLEMDHCIGGSGFARRARAWQGYGYSVGTVDTHDRLATVWIVPSHQTPGAFTLEQIQGPSNKPVSPAIRQRVDRWLLAAKQASGLPPEPEACDAPPGRTVLHPDWAPAAGIDANEWRTRLYHRAVDPLSPHLLHAHHGGEHDHQEVFMDDGIPF